MKMRNALILSFLCLLVSAAALLADDSIVINKTPVEVKIRTFNPQKPPAEMPPLKGDEAAVAVSQFGCEAAISVLITQSGDEIAPKREVKIESVKVTLQLWVTIWLPNNAPQKLKAHEQGHRRISEKFYENAEKIAAELARPLVGQALEAAGADLDSAVQQAIEQTVRQFCGEYMNQTHFPAERVQKIYDKITDHGRNSLAEDKAIEQALAQDQLTTKARRHEDKRKEETK